MGYMEILKRAWATTWKYKILWLFGLFVGSGGGSNFNYDFGSGSRGGGTSAGTDVFGRQLESAAQQNLPLLIAIGVFVFLLGVVFFVLTFAAQGGLVHLANEAEEKREVRGGDGWRVGFKNWGRVFVIDLLVALPIIVVVLLIAVLFGAAIVGIVASAAGLDSGSSAAGVGLASSIGGLCCAGLLLLVVSIAYAIVFGTTAQLALRYAILEDRPAIASLKAGWSDVWAKRGAVAMWFTVWLVGLVYALALGVLLTIFVVPIVLMTIAGNIVGAVGLTVLMSLVSALPTAVFGAFVSCAWTLFFRRMTGRDAMIAPVPAGGYAPPVPMAPPAGYPPPPPPPVADAAPPAAPEPPAWAPPEPPPAPEPAPVPPAPPEQVEEAPPAPPAAGDAPPES